MNHNDFLKTLTEAKGQLLQHAYNLTDDATKADELLQETVTRIYLYKRAIKDATDLTSHSKNIMQCIYTTRTANTIKTTLLETE